MNTKIPKKKSAKPLLDSKRKRTKKVGEKRKKNQIIAKNQNSSSHKKKKQRRKKKATFVKTLRTTILQLIIAIIIVGLIVYALSFFLFSVPKVSGYAMMPELANGDRLFVNKLETIKRFDLVVLKANKQRDLSVRRVIGMPDEDIYYKNDQLYIDDTFQVERYLEKPLKDAHQDSMLLTGDFTLNQISGAKKIPEKKYLVLGDNRRYSTDSRNYGLVEDTDIIGVVRMRWLPLQSMKSF